jgi:GNAT superfamily N-acetyltransferase
MIRLLAVHEGAAGLVSYSQGQLTAALAGDPPRLHAILAEDADGIHGFVTYTIDFSIWNGGDILRIDDVFVNDDARRRGIGRQMMMRIAELALAGGMIARWEIEPVNVRAQKFYRNLGATTRDKIVARWEGPAMAATLDRPNGRSRKTT